MSEIDWPTYNVSLVDFTWYAQNVPCQSACPVSTAAGSYVRSIYRGDMDEAYRIARGPNPLMHVCSRICAHPCEDQCRRGKIDEPISIRQLKRTVSDYWHELPDDKKPKLDVAEKREEKIAVIGAGPAGMAATTALLQKGYAVTLFEATDALGGMLIHGIPPYRLPREVIDWDYAFITDNGGEIKTNAVLGKDFTIDDLEKDGYGAIFIGPGAVMGLLPRAVDGAELPGVLIGVDFLRAFNRGDDIDMGRRVVIIGGGNVAIDVARSVRRLPTEGETRDITMLVLEARDQMLASDDEIQEALEENITIRNSMGPNQFLEYEGRVAGVETRVATCVYDETGCFNPQFVDGSEAHVKADTVIVAIGQRPDIACLQDILELTGRGTIKFDPDTMATSRSNVFTGGDGARGPRIAIDAVADGLRAAESIHCYLSKAEPTRRKAVMKTVSNVDLPPIADSMCRQSLPLLPPGRREPSTEVCRSYSPDAARAEAARCLDCYIQTVFDSDKCIACGGCMDVCPMRCLRLIDTRSIAEHEETAAVLQARYHGEPGTAIIKDEEQCIRCGLCEKRCPTGTITMERFSIEALKEETHGA